MADRNSFKTDEDYSLFDFCFENHMMLLAKYQVGETLKDIKGMVSGYHPELNMVSIKCSTGGRDHCIPIRNIEEIEMLGSYL